MFFSADISCDFEGNLCGWSSRKNPNSNNNNYIWKVISGKTPSRITGPESASSGNSYIYVESTNSPRGAIAELISPRFDMKGENYCMKFFLHMYLSTTTKASIEIFGMKNDGSNNTLFYLGRPLGNDWFNFTISLFKENEYSQVKIMKCKKLLII